jgi:hypothetical protein
MTVSVATKTIETTLFTGADCASGSMYIGSEIDVSTKFQVAAFVRLGRTVTTALSNYVGFKLEASARASGADFWVPVYVWQNADIAVTGIIPASNLLNGATSAGATTYALDSATGQNAGDLVFFYESTKYEWARTKSVSSVTATPLDPLVYAHADNCIVLDRGEEWVIPLDVSSYKRLRLVVDTASAGGSSAAATGYTVFVQAFLGSLDSISS